MKRFGVFCPPMLGHLNPMAVLGLELQRRGHTVIFFGVADGLYQLRGLGFTSIEMGVQEYPQGQVERDYRQLGRLTGRQGFQYTIQLFQREMTMFLKEAPMAIKQAQIDLLLIDQVTALIPTIADYLKIPFVTICNAMLVNREAAIPPYSSLYPYSDSFWARLRNRWGNLQITYSTRAIWLPIIKQRRIWGLKPYANPEARFSSLAQICQFPRELDFPRQKLAPCFHYIGRFQDPAATEPIALAGLDFPFEKLEAGPLIYASLGTLQNQRPEIFRCIAQACLSLPAQLVISLGNPNAQPMPLPGEPLVVPFAPHQKLIARSTLVITHAGLNTVLTALGCGVPLVAIPITNEQPGIAARIRYVGVGDFIALKDLNENTLRSTIERVFYQSHYHQRAQQLAQKIKEAGGVNRAADIVETVANTGNPVLSSSFEDRQVAGSSL